MKVHYGAFSSKPLTESKGVLHEVESEGIKKQNSKIKFLGYSLNSIKGVVGLRIYPKSISTLWDKPQVSTSQLGKF